MLDALLDIAAPHETKTYEAAGSGRMVLAVAERSVDEQYAAAFRRRWPDIEIEKEAESAVARLQEEPRTVLEGVIAGLDAWMLERRWQKKHSEEQWRCLLRLVERLDDSEQRRQLRALLIGAVPPRAEEVVGLLAGQPPWPALWELARGHDWRRLRQLRGRMNAETEPVPTVLLLAGASSDIGDTAGAEEVLRLALARRPDEVALLDALGKVLERQGRLAEAIGCYRAARAKRKNLGVALGLALGKAGQGVEGEAVLRDLLRQQPENPEMFYYLGVVLYGQEKFAAAARAWRQALALKPDYAEAYNNLGVALDEQGKYADAEAAYRQALVLKPDYADAYSNLSVALGGQGKFVEAAAVCRQALALKPDVAMAYNNLGNALNDQGKHVEAEAAYHQALALKPDSALAYVSLGNALDGQGKYVEAEAAFRQALALKPEYAEVYYNLGNALSGQEKYREAEAAFRKALSLKPDLTRVYLNLGNALYDQGKYAEAEAVYRKSIALKLDVTKAYNNLGHALSGQEKYREAEAAFREALALKPDSALAYVNLGFALGSQGKYVEEEAVCRKALALQPDFALAHCNLGVALNGQGKYVEAEAACRQALALKADFALAHHNLGVALNGQGKNVEAEAAYRKAIALKPDYAEAYNNLGVFLNGQGKYVEAEAAFRKAIALKPDFTLSYVNLGIALRGQGRFAESLVAYQRGHELGSKQPAWRYPSPQWVRAAERLVELEKKLPAVLQGEAAPANAGDAITLAQMCQQPYKKRYAASARLYADAFATDRKLGDDLDAQYRYDAACSAALAAAGQGADARLLPDKVVIMFRHWALGWLHDDLTAYAKHAERNNPDANKMIQQRMEHRRSDPDLASVRDPQALNRLPDDERAAWQALWRDVDQLRIRVANKDKAGEPGR